MSEQSVTHSLTVWTFGVPISSILNTRMEKILWLQKEKINWSIHFRNFVRRWNKRDPKREVTTGDEHKNKMHTKQL